VKVLAAFIASIISSKPRDDDNMREQTVTVTPLCLPLSYYSEQSYKINRNLKNAKHNPTTGQDLKPFALYLAEIRVIIILPRPARPCNSIFIKKSLRSAFPSMPCAVSIYVIFNFYIVYSVLYDQVNNSCNSNKYAIL